MHHFVGIFVPQYVGAEDILKTVVQGGLEIPYILQLEITDDVLMSKTCKLLDCCQEKEDSESLRLPSRKIKLEDTTFAFQICLLQQKCI